MHRILVGARPRRGETDDPDNWPTYKLIWPHLVPSQAEECTEARTRQLLIDWVRYQWKHGEFESCLSLAQRLQKLWTTQLGPDHPQTLHLRFQIANVLRSQGRFIEARELDTYVLERQRAVLGHDHLLALMTADGLAADLRSLGEYREALDIDRKTYESFKDEFGEDYERTLLAAHNLACSLRLVGDYRAALGWTRTTMTAAGRSSGRSTLTPCLTPVTWPATCGRRVTFSESVELLRRP